MTPTGVEQTMNRAMTAPSGAEQTMNRAMTPSGVEQTSNNALQYLEKASIEETATRLRSEGYAVEVPGGGPDVGIDLVASKGDRKIAVQIKARPSLRESAKEIGRIREGARARGFDEFRLVIVNPPHDREVSVAGLERELRRWIEENPGDLASIASRVVVLDVVATDLSRLGVTKESILVAGVGAVLVECEEVGGEQQGGMTWTTDFPVSFDVKLTHELAIESVEKLEIDLSSFDD